jgi:hypothetical protein
MPGYEVRDVVADVAEEWFDADDVEVADDVELDEPPDRA